MNTKLQRPEMKLANTKVSDKDMIYFSLGLDSEDYVLPSERDDYRSDARAVKLVQDIKAGKDLSNQDFSGINLKGADISGGHFSGASFKGAIFYKTNAHGADFTGCDFTEAYFEESDFSDCLLKEAVFQKTYLRKLTVQNADMDEDLEKRLHTMEVLIALIESGKIDIHCLTRSELMCLDLRRLDMSKVDVSDLDLSMFNLEGVNLRGIYINPLQKLSMDQWQKDLLAVEKLSEKKLKEETLKAVKAHRKELAEFAKSQTEIKDIKTRQLARPRLKRDEFKPIQKESLSEKPLETKPEETDNIMKPNRITDKNNKIALKEKKLKHRT